MRMKLMIILVIGFVSLAVGGPFASSNDKGPKVRVLVLRYDNAKPVKGLWMLLEMLNEHGKSDGMPGLSVRTNGEGVAEFYLPNPVPERLALAFNPNDFGSCSDYEFSTEQVLKSGVVSEGSCSDPKLHYSEPPRPGVLVVFGRRVPWWEQMWREIP